MVPVPAGSAGADESLALEASFDRPWSVAESAGVRSLSIDAAEESEVESCGEDVLDGFCLR